jgi:hypothetical protein
VYRPEQYNVENADGVNIKSPTMPAIKEDWKNATKPSPTDQEANAGTRTR